MKNESTKHVAAFTGRVFFDDKSCDEDLVYDELVVS